jgi:hypothetical protein
MVYLRFPVFLGGSPGITYSKSQLDVPIYFRSYSLEELFVSALFIHQDITY